jgi:SAM-dependent methyltransferase
MLFDAAAEDYEAWRPHYPAALFDDLAVLAGLSPGSRVLEIGCGTGIATRDLLDRGWVVDAVEPGAQMARVARREAGRAAALHIDVTTFEDWVPGAAPYALVFSATAIHWVDPRVRWTKSAIVLEPGGHLALATNRTLRGGSFDELYEQSAGLERRHAPEMIEEGQSPELEQFLSDLDAAALDIGTLWGAADPKGGGAAAGGSFEAPVLCTYPWEKTYDRDQAIGLLGTYSPYLALPEEQRTALLDGMGELIDERFGGAVTRRYLSILAVARRFDR